MPEVILPCPNPKCRSKFVMTDTSPSGADIVTCCTCFMHGPYCDTEESAIAAWNALPRTPEWQEQPKVNEWNRWTDGTCNNVTFIRQDGTGVVSGCVMHWKEIGDRWFPIPTPEDVT